MKSARERFLDVARFKGSELCMPATPILFNCFWPETIQAWRQSPSTTCKTLRDFTQYLQFDQARFMPEVCSGMVYAQLKVGGIEHLDMLTPLVPLFPGEVVKEDPKSITAINRGGQTVMLNKDSLGSMPMYLDYPVRDRETWNEFKKRLDPDTPARWPEDWQKFTAKFTARDYPLGMSVGSFFGYLHEWMGLERLVLTMYDDPKFIEEIMDHVLNMELTIIKRVMKDIKFDFALFWEDMAYNAGPMIHPDMFRKFMMPRYKVITSLLRNAGVDIIFVDSDGNIEKLIPLWIESGINGVWPLECAAGMDAVAIRKRYGKDLIIAGNIDKRRIAEGKDAIDKEVKYKVPPLMKDGGYFPSLDHGVPPDVSLENYVYYLNQIRELYGWEKIK